MLCVFSNCLGLRGREGSRRWTWHLLDFSHSNEKLRNADWLMSLAQAMMVSWHKYRRLGFVQRPLKVWIAFKTLWSISFSHSFTFYTTIFTITSESSPGANPTRTLCRNTSSRSFSTSPKTPPATTTTKRSSGSSSVSATSSGDCCHIFPPESSLSPAQVLLGCPAVSLRL